MITSRTYIRPQNELRSFFGLGPAEISAVDEIRPVVEVGSFVSYQEQQIIASTTNPAPGASTTLIPALPRPGYWLLDHVGIRSAGPTTSGFGNVSPFFRLQRAGAEQAFGLIERDLPYFQFVTTTGIEQFWGMRFSPPALLFLNAQISDLVGVNVFNASSSVGSMLVTLVLLARQLELVKD